MEPIILIKRLDAVEGDKRVPPKVTSVRTLGPEEALFVRPGPCSSKGKKKGAGRAAKKANLIGRALASASELTSDSLDTEAERASTSRTSHFVRPDPPLASQTDADVDSDVSVGGGPEARAEDRGRGRPPTTFQHTGAAKKMKKKLEEAKKKEPRIREIEEDVLDPVPPKTKAWEACCTLEAAQVELREAPIPTLLELLREDTVAVFKAANCSSGMKDTLVKAIYRATARIRAAAGVLGKGALQAEYGPGRVEGSPRRYPRDPQDSLLRNQEPAAVKTASRSPMVGSSMMDAEPEIPPPDIMEGSGRGETHMEMDSDPEISHLPPLPSTFRVEKEPREQRAPRVRRREPRNTGPREIVVESPILGRRVIPKPLDTGRRRREAAEEAPPTVVRPSLQGKCTPLEYNYPRGLRPEDKEAYARVSAQIDALLKERERLAQGDTRAAPSTSPPEFSRAPSPPIVPVTITSPPRGGGGAEEKKGKGKRKEGKAQQAPPSKGRRVAGNPPPRKTEPAGGPKGPVSKGRTITAPSKQTRPAPPSQRADKAAPTSSQAQPGATWTEVVGRKKRRTQARAAKGPAPTAGPKPATTTKSTASSAKKKAPKRKVPRTAAISLHCPEGEYADAMRAVKANISLEQLGIGVPHMRKGATGAFILEIAGENSGPKADALAARMAEVLAGREGVRVGRPQKKADLRLRDVDDTTTEAEIATSVATIGGCCAADVRVGPIRRSPRRMGTVWVQCPAANKVAAAGKIQLGWSMARAELLDVRPLQCFKCLEKGHVQANCPGGSDRRDVCLRCGTKGHIARECTAPVKCPVCAELGRKSDHRIGSQRCTPPKRRPAKGGPAGKKPAPPKATAPRPRASAEENKRRAAAQTAASPKRGRQPSSKKRKLAEQPEDLPVLAAPEVKMAEPPAEQPVPQPTGDVAVPEATGADVAVPAVTGADAPIIEETVEEPMVVGNDNA